MFIKSIIFPEWHPFYNNGEPIVFHDDQKNLIDFYLRTTKKIKEWEKDIEFWNNIQINCILGDNGAGKSRFLKECTVDDRDTNSRKVELSYTSNIRKSKYVKILFDDFHSISSNHGLSIHKKMFDDFQEKSSLESIYIDIHGFIEKNTTIKRIFCDFLNLEINFRSNLVIKPNYEWYRDFWWSHIEFIEIDSKEWLNAFINNALYKDYNWEWDKKDLLCIFQFLYSKSQNDNLEEFPNLNTKINSNTAFEYWQILSDLFISLVNQFRNSIDFITNSDEEKFIELENYTSFKEIIIQLQYFLEKSKDSIVNIQDKIHWQLSENFFLSITDIKHYYDNILYSINGLLLIFRQLEEKKKDEALRLSEELFWLHLHELLRHISGYEKSYVDANDYFLIELALRFGKEDKINIEKIARTFQWIFYYIFRNPSQEKIRYKLDNYNINYTENYNLSRKEIILLGFPFFKIHLEFQDKTWTKSIENLSGWEKTMLLRFSNIYMSILKNLSNFKNFIILIDEPDLHLHLDWQRQYIQRLIDVFSTLQYPDISLHFIIATHSPFIVSDIPWANIIRMKKDSNGGVTFQNYWEWENKKESSFWANYVDIIQQWFFDNRLLMGSFAEEAIKNLAVAEKIKLSQELLKDNYKWTSDTKNIESYLRNSNEKAISMKEQIGDEFIRNHLLYFKTNENNTNS